MWNDPPLCTYLETADEIDIGLASGSEDDTTNEEFYNAALLTAMRDLGIEVLDRISTDLDRYVDGIGIYTPESIRDRLSNPELLKGVAIAWTIHAILMRGETRLRFQYDTDRLESMLKIRKLDKIEKLDKVWRRLLFDVNNDGQINTLDRAFTNKVTSTSYTV